MKASGLKKFGEKGPSKKGERYIVVAHNADGPKVTDYATKKEAHAAGQELRRQGIKAFAHSEKDAKKLGLDPRKGGGDERDRDDQGRFA